MVAADLGIEALCLYLGLTEGALEEHVLRLGLNRPHHRPLRKQGRAGWAAADVTRLVVWRVSGIHPATIAARLSRSASGVRSKARRLGVPAPRRKALRRVDPTTLADPQQGWFFNLDPAALYPRDEASPVAGDTVIRHPAAVPSPPNPAFRQRKSTKPSSQREMPFFGVVPAPEAHQPETTNAGSVPGRGTALVSVPAPPSRAGQTEILGEADLAWIGRTRRIGSNEKAVRAISLRYFGGQHPKYIAREAGISVAAVQGVLYRANIPRDRDRRKFGESFDLEMAHATLDASGYVLVRDKTGVGRESGAGHLFWKHRTDRGVTTTRVARLRNGIISEYDRYRSQDITLLTRADLNDPSLDWDDDTARAGLRRPAGKAYSTPAAFANHPATMARSHPSSGARL